MTTINTSTCFLEGEWKGRGTVLKNGLEYSERAIFTVWKRAEPVWVINWQQFTHKLQTTADDGDKKRINLHAENGFLKIIPSVTTSLTTTSTPPVCHTGNKAELTLSHPFSVNEMYTNAVFNFEEDTFVCQALGEDCFQRAAPAKGKLLTGIRREYKLVNETSMVYDIWIAVEGGELVHHLHGELKRQDEL